MQPRIARSIRRIVAIAVVLSLLSPAGLGVAAAQEDESAVTYVRTVEEITGHMQTSVADLEAGEREAAVKHTEEVLEELGPIVVTELEAENESLATELNESLHAANAAAEEDSASAYAELVQNDVLPLLERAETTAVADSKLTNTTFNAKVVAGLLERANAEYKEGIDTNGTVTEEMDYWAAQTYADRASARYESQIKGDVSEHAAEELDEMFESLGSATENKQPPADVDSLSNSITHELAEYTGLEVEASGDGAAVIERIEGDLHEAVEAYEAGNQDQAKSIIKQTYLSNFEGIEGTLIEENPDLVEELEADFNEELPGLIDEGAPVSEVSEKVESMESKLHEAEEILASQEDEDIDLSSGDEQTTTAEPTSTSTTSTTTPGFGALVAAVAIGLIALARYRRP